jgi:hypothetical protein
MVNIDLGPQLEWRGYHTEDDVYHPGFGETFWYIRVLDHHFDEILAFWPHTHHLPLFCLAGNASNGLDDRIEYVLGRKLGMTKNLGGRWRK